MKIMNRGLFTRMKLICVTKEKTYDIFALIFLSSTFLDFSPFHRVVFPSTTKKSISFFLYEENKYCKLFLSLDFLQEIVHIGFLKYYPTIGKLYQSEQRHKNWIIFEKKEIQVLCIHTPFLQLLFLKKR